jgi:phospholipid transport system transporter-binding protein
MNDTVAIEYQQSSIVIIGELNFTTVVSLWNESLPKLAAYPSLHFDLAKVSTKGSGGVALILEWIKYAKRHNKPINFSNVPANLLSILSVSGISNMLNGSAQ